MKHAALVLLLLVFSGCAARLPPHVWMPVERVEAVDLFWWTETGICQIRVIWWDGDTPKGFTVNTDAALCRERLRVSGYAEPK